MSKTLIFGHRKPDTDSICSAISYAYLKEQLGISVEAVRLGDINKETEFALNYFNISETPREISRIDEDVKEVILVDHNEFQQSAENIADVRIVEVVDHHRIANFETANPLYFRAEPVGCTATILNKLFKENGEEIPKQIAGLLLSAIISDTLLLKSPTCTEEDVEAAKELAHIADVDMEVYGLEMLKAGTDLAGKTAAELIALDAKEFTMGGEKVEIAQINVINTEDVYEDQAEIETAIEDVIKEKDLSLFLLLVTDILNNNSEVLALGKSSKNVEKAFGTSLNDQNRALLKGVVSRKKQVVTPLTDAFNE